MSPRWHGNTRVLESAWAELVSDPEVVRFGATAALRSGAFKARYRSVCARCHKRIEVGATIRYHLDFQGPVHSRCHQTRQQREKSTRDQKRPEKTIPLCEVCNLEHVNECF